MTRSRVSLLLSLALVAFLLPQAAFAGADVVIVNLDAGTGQGLDDPTVVAPVGGNPGTTLGAQRLNVFEVAANLWGDVLNSTVPIRVEATFTPLQCNPSSAVLGAAGAQTVHANFPGAPVPSTWYPAALANALSGSDQDPATGEIIAFFNSQIDNNNNCLFNTNWYLGLDQNPGTDIDFLTVVLHEIGHGLGFASFVDETTGQLLGPPFLHDIWNEFLLDATNGLLWKNMTNAQRAASAINTGNLTWSGPSVTSQLSQFSNGVNANGFIQMYAPNPVQPGSSVSHYDTAVTPNVLMEPFITGPTSDLDITPRLLEDIGWTTMQGYQLLNPSPGLAGTTNNFTSIRGTPGATTFLIFGFNPGTINIPGCPGVSIGMLDPTILSSGPNDAAGQFTFPLALGAGASGVGVLLQAVELSTCTVSNLINYTFP